MKRGWPILLISILWMSCSTSRHLIDEVVPDNKKTAEIIEQVYKNEFAPAYLSLKSNSSYKAGEESNSFKASIRLKKDSVIWMSVTAYGYEVMRVLARTDSIFLLNRPKKEFYAGTFEEVSTKMGVNLDFDIMQAIFLGNSVGFEEMKKVKRLNDEKYFVLTSLNKNQFKRVTEKDKTIKEGFGIAFTHWVNPATYRVERINFLDLETMKSANIYYEDFEEQGDFQIATEVRIEAEGPKPFLLKNEYSRISVEDEVLNFPFKIPSKYEPIKIL